MRPPVPFRFERLEIPDVLLVEAATFADSRGFFRESYKASAFAEAGVDVRFVQDNYSRSRDRVFRGLHYQNPPEPQAKLVQVITGEIMDYAVDIRKGSPTYGRFVTAHLTESNHRSLFVPQGFAHGFCVLSDRADVLYKVSTEYSAELDRGIKWNDPAIGIELPVADPVLSDKDAALPSLTEADNGFTYGQRGPHS
jgi:dTDP-4-dehydrorhamnose 3,5-epimerase